MFDKREVNSEVYKLCVCVCVCVHMCVCECMHIHIHVYVCVDVFQWFEWGPGYFSDNPHPGILTVHAHTSPPAQCMI